MVRGSVEETLNGLLEAEAEALAQAARYERSEERQGYREVLGAAEETKEVAKKVEGRDYSI